MRLFGQRKPNVRALSSAGDVAGLLDAAAYMDLLPESHGGVVDLGVPVREEAVRAIASFDGEQAESVVVRALSDRSERVQLAAIEVLRKRGHVGPLAEALGWLPEGNGRARDLAIEALLERCSPGCSRQLVRSLLRRPGNRQLSEGDQRVVSELLEAEAGREATAEVMRTLLTALGDQEEVGRERAESLLVCLAPESVEPLIEELARGVARDRAAAVLGAIKDIRAVEPLGAALEDGNARVRAASCVALGELRDPAAVEPLLRATRDPEHLVRARAGSALDRIGMVAVVVGVSTLIRPALGDGRSRKGAQDALPGNGLRLMPPSTQAATSERPSILRRFARFIERVDDARLEATEPAAPQGPPYPAR